MFLYSYILAVRQIFTLRHVPLYGVRPDEVIWITLKDKTALFHYQQIEIHADTRQAGFLCDPLLARLPAQKV